MRPFDESDLIAYHFHELPSQEENELRYALHNNPALAAESASIAAILAEYKHHSPSDVDASAVERNWQAIRHMLPRVPVAPSPFFRWRLPIFAGAGLALAMPIFFAVRHPEGPELQREIQQSHIADATAPVSTSPVEPSQQQTVAGSMPRIPRFLNHISAATPASNSPFHPATQTTPQHVSQQNVAEPHSATESVAGSPRFPATPAALPSTSVSASQANSTVALAQASTATQTTKGHTASKHRPDTDFTLSMGGTFIATHGTTTNGITTSEGATNTVNVIGSFHQQFRPFVGYRVAVSYTRPQFHYFRSTDTGTSGEQGIKGRVYELAGTYVVRGPHREKLITYVEAGAGMMAILPPFPDTATDYNISPAGIVGVSADIPVSKHIGVHAAYRAQVFKGPEFHANPAVYPLANSNILIGQEPSVGITYRFTQKQQQ